MKRLPYHFLLILGIIICMPGCSRYVCWLKDVFNPGCKQPTPIKCVEPYIRSVRIYNEFDTLGIFDALWLHTSVREMYLDAYSSTRCLTSSQWKSLVQQQEYEDNNYIMFYLLAWIPSGSLLTDLCPEWHVQLRIDCVCYNPIEIKIVELCPEYKRFFGPWFTIFKKQYLLKFSAIDAQGLPLINPSTSCIELVFKRLGVEDCMEWCVDRFENVIPLCSFNRDILAYDIDINI